ncbi:MAG: SUMF1/EgtB/PvdO family nonheme iron enzyme [Thermosynechococcaceae cyanobacterium]
MPSPSTTLSPAEHRIRDFTRQYDELTLNLACHAAFPLTLTSELVYCLRETFLSECPWYTGADILLSGLCKPIGYDLYEIDNLTRKGLLDQLIKRFGEARLDDLQNFMATYIEHQLQTVDRKARVRMLGDKPHWTALACLRPNEAFQRIQAELQQWGELGDPNDRFHWAALVESHADLLADAGFQPILLEWSKKTAKGEPISDEATVIMVMTKAGFPSLKTLEIEVETIVFADDEQQAISDTLKPFTFETITIDKRGQETSRSPHTAYTFTETLPEGINLEMVAIPSGEFMMGSPQTEHEQFAREGPQRKVTVQPFFLGKYPITQAQWRIVAGLPQVKRPIDTDPSRFKGNQHPVEQVSWLDAEEFCLRLSQATGRTYRLPSEAEWEYACRAGTQTPFYFGETLTGNLANYYSDVTYQQEKKVKSLSQTTPVGKYPPNAFGLYDMHGNVWEWCLDHWHNSYEGAPDNGSAWLTTNENNSRLLRGGSWNSDPGRCRSAYRFSDTPDDRIFDVGFRVVCEAPRTL